MRLYRFYEPALYLSNQSKRCHDSMQYINYLKGENKSHIASIVSAKEGISSHYGGTVTPPYVFVWSTASFFFREVTAHGLGSNHRGNDADGLHLYTN